MYRTLRNSICLRACKYLVYDKFKEVDKMYALYTLAIGVKH